MDRAETERWLKNIPVISQPSDEQIDSLRALYGSVGLTTLLGLLLGSRQAHYALLSNVPLGDGVSDCAAAVIQGKIRGLDIAYDTVREMALPETANEGAEA